MPVSDWRLCVAPMIDVTDRHCRYFHRLLAPRARLYTEMITTGALLHGKVARHLDFDPAEEPVALQLGGSEPEALAESARLGQQWGYDEINLNCGCPSERVQKGAFGACLMAEPALVADCVKAMQDAVSIPVTVKHRLGLDYDDSYGFVRDFVGKIHDTGCRVFIVHARNAVLKGLSPKDNREKPPLRYDMAARIKADFPDCTIVLNGGITGVYEVASLLGEFDGVMLGRAAWHNPGILSDISRSMHPDLIVSEPAQIVQAMVQYAGREIEKGVPLRLIVRSMLGWMSGRAGARYWRRTLSDHSQLNDNDARLIDRAWSDLVLRASEEG
ncbi:tRNA dihydrouridine(20/20a) synthase DusA [Pollutimonas nitritireducens]|uniref:tRNA-dihydrouridine(20/20a) synthase n=1 Tax=Pollutimonas nitritireducens TaxID=2045209 RepID=A0A2N4UCD0_9BURK|nr:tRNA dihydrouridine(20/20a) synthase DusA [Pollutimonas nitritireducens]PLC52647.1 tRNA dihydrouridine(20/20a) synthase DusA [Pollutimonas nitritireducens]